MTRALAESHVGGRAVGVRRRHRPHGAHAPTTTNDAGGRQPGFVAASHRLDGRFVQARRAVVGARSRAGCSATLTFLYYKDINGNINILLFYELNMRTYDVAIASLVIRAPLKWTDNLLAQYDVTGVTTGRRGVTRRIPHATLLLLAVTRELHVEGRLGVRDALALAARLLAEGEGDVPVSGHLRVVLDRASFERALDLRLRDALESAPSPSRGRPPRRA
jgi:hypothetical protein